MDQASLWLSIFIGVLIVIINLPAVAAMNRGKMLRNTAIWLAIALALAVVYRVFGPFPMAMNSLPTNQRAAQQQEAAPDGRPKLSDDSDALADDTPRAQDKPETIEH